MNQTNGGPVGQTTPQPSATSDAFTSSLRDILSGMAMGSTPGDSLSMAGKMLAVNGGKREATQKAQAKQSQTLQWLTTKGVDANTASYLASDPQALRSWFGEYTKGQQPNWQLHDLADGKYMVDMNDPTRRNKISGPKEEAAPTSVKEYQFYSDQTQKAGETPLPYSQWDTSRKRAGAMSVNTGTIPQGYEQYTDPASGAVRMRAIPGGPKDVSAKDQAKSEARATSTDVITNAAGLARKAINDATLPTTGTVGNLLSSVGETGAAELNRQLAVLKSNATIENLNAMRQQSPTGGALGNVTEGEGAMLAAKSGALDPRAPKAQVQRSLDDYERTLLRIVHGKDAGDKIYNQTRAGSPQDQGWQDVGGVKIRRKQ